MGHKQYVGLMDAPWVTSNNVGLMDAPWVTSNMLG